MNTLRTAMPLAALTAIFIGLSFLIGGSGGALFAFLVAAGLNFFAYWNADRMVLAMARAREVDARSAPEFYAIVEELADEIAGVMAHELGHVKNRDTLTMTVTSTIALPRIGTTGRPRGPWG